MYELEQKSDRGRRYIKSIIDKNLKDIDMVIYATTYHVPGWSEAKM